MKHIQEVIDRKKLLKYIKETDMNDLEIEQEIQNKGLNAPRLTPDLIESKIVGESYYLLTDVLTVCVLTLENGFTVTGESACASPANYNEEIGNKIADFLLSPNLPSQPYINSPTRIKSSLLANSFSLK